jgi:hypothetical protein
MLLSRRDDVTGGGACKIELLCTSCDAIFWRWMDRPDDALAEFPDDIARWRRQELAKGSDRPDAT